MRGTDSPPAGHALTAGREPRVTAVIPTSGRETLARALASVASQSVPVEAVVVCDKLDESSSVEQVAHRFGFRAISTAGHQGGAEARNVGVAASTTEYVAFLDDDDAWHPDKTRRQLALLDASDGARSVAACRARLIDPSTSAFRVVPETPYDNERDMASYLLARRHLRLRDNFMQTSMLIAPRSLLSELPWNQSLRRHQDWDLVIRWHRSGVVFHTAPEPLVDVYQASAGSISKSADWRASLDWLASMEAPDSRRASADFVLSIGLRAALRGKDPRGAIQAIRASAVGVPHLAAAAIGLSPLLEKKK
ncbi:glycosyltransferase family 2 protein [Demequina silvatica]|uniref:glycosyltransferase family 2 protein n=1 Tax=Demequina silvatica TaxID=1638988 RepID=UPI0009E52CBA|nr:glycosyltransferase [Demequina silvatica]